MLIDELISVFSEIEDKELVARLAPHMYLQNRNDVYNMGKFVTLRFIGPFYGDAQGLSNIEALKRLSGFYDTAEHQEEYEPLKYVVSITDPDGLFGGHVDVLLCNLDDDAAEVLIEFAEKVDAMGIYDVDLAIQAEDEALAVALEEEEKHYGKENSWEIEEFLRDNGVLEDCEWCYDEVALQNSMEE